MPAQPSDACGTEWISNYVLRCLKSCSAVEEQEHSSDLGYSSSHLEKQQKKILGPSLYLHPHVSVLLSPELPHDIQKCLAPALGHLRPGDSCQLHSIVSQPGSQCSARLSPAAVASPTSNPPGALPVTAAATEKAADEP